MNNKGQTLVIFIIFVPIIILILTLIIDLGMLQNKKNELLKVTELIIEDVLTKEGYEPKELVKRLYTENNIELDSLEVKTEENKLNIKARMVIPGTFSQLLKVKNYEIEISLTGYRQDGKIIIEKG